MKKAVTIWKALLDGDCKKIADSEHSLLQQIEHNPWFEPAERDRWTIQAERRDVPVVTGQTCMADRWYVDLEAPIPDDLGLPHAQAPHVLWACPIGGEEHYTDVEQEDETEALWVCDNGTMDDIVAVQWDWRDGATKASLYHDRRDRAFLIGTTDHTLIGKDRTTSG